MAWIEPKTDWLASDYFNCTDYNRIIGNLSHLKGLAEELFGKLNTVDMGANKMYSSMIFAYEINKIEHNLDVINLNTYAFDIGSKTTYRDNGATPLYSEFNRIESACLLLYDTMIAHKNALPRLAITLGSQKGIRV